MKKTRIIHIHTDVKFIDDIERFDSAEFENTIVIFGNKGTYKGIYKDCVIYSTYSRKAFSEIISFSETADMVVLYDLGFPQAYIANRLTKSVIVVWRFFGTELYKKIPEQVHSDKTLKILQKGRQYYFHENLTEVLSSYMYRIKYNACPVNEFNKAAFNRTDLFLGVSKLEYDFLKLTWPNLPSFLQLNLPPYLQAKTSKSRNSNLIILGNNRRPYNNHLDIIDGLKKSKNRNNFEFLLMFNYGSNNTYTNIVRREASKVKEIKVLEDFLALEKFKQLYTNADAFVMNGHRQMAMGNILEALQQNIKIYLNEKNLIYSWLKEIGVVVFTIENFFHDLEANNIALSHADALINQKQLVKFAAEHNILSFQKTISEILNDWSNLKPSNLKRDEIQTEIEIENEMDPDIGTLEEINASMKYILSDAEGFSNPSALTKKLINTSREKS